VKPSKVIDRQVVPSRGFALLITGRPGVGKTTAVRRIADSLSGWRLAGFYTAEIRIGTMRQGFLAVTFGGIRKVMAHVDSPSPHRVGKYGVDVALIDHVADTDLAITPTVDLYLVDEIGKMDTLSDRIIVAMRRLFASHVPLIATIASRGGGLIAEAKAVPRAVLWELTRANRDDLPVRALTWLEATRATPQISLILFHKSDLIAIAVSPLRHVGFHGPPVPAHR
jgi:nucleoside-triphosphatase